MKQLLVLLIRFYQYAISPLPGAALPVFPSCSEYTPKPSSHGVWKD